MNNVFKFWNMIRQSRNKLQDSLNSIQIDQLYTHFKEKFDYNPEVENTFIQQAKSHVNNKIKNVNEVIYADFMFTEYDLRQFVKSLKSGCAAGVDGVTSEHLKYAEQSDIIIHLCHIFTICFKFGVMPTESTKGILVPVLKKPTLDLASSKNYRPVILSTVYSKLIEKCILQECSDFEFNDAQFGFVKGRGVSTAATLVHDITSYFVNKGSQIYVCPRCRGRL